MNAGKECQGDVEAEDDLFIGEPGGMGELREIQNGEFGWMKVDKRCERRNASTCQTQPRAMVRLRSSTAAQQPAERAEGQKGRRC